VVGARVVLDTRGRFRDKLPPAGVRFSSGTGVRVAVNAEPALARAISSLPGDDAGGFGSRPAPACSAILTADFVEPLSDDTEVPFTGTFRWAAPVHCADFCGRLLGRSAMLFRSTIGIRSGRGSTAPPLRGRLVLWTTPDWIRPRLVAKLLGGSSRCGQQRHVFQRWSHSGLIPFKMAEESSRCACWWALPAGFDAAASARAKLFFGPHGRRRQRQAKHVPPDSPVEPGEVIAGKYRVDSVIAVGGMDRVRRRAPPARSDGGDQGALADRARPGASRRHALLPGRVRRLESATNVVRIYDVDTLPPGCPAWSWSSPGLRSARAAQEPRATAVADVVRRHASL
jgi:hypothetical protein